MSPAIRQPAFARTVLVTLLVVAFVLVTLAVCPAGARAYSVPEFDDVNPTYGYYEAIMGLREHGGVDGYTDNTFRPENNLMRAQFAKVIVLVLGMTDTSGFHVNESMVAPFTDLGPDSSTTLYPHDYIAVVADRGVTMGTSPTTFSPWLNVTRAQVATMVVRATQTMYPSALATPPAGFTGALGDFGPPHAENMRIAEYNGFLHNLGGYGPGWSPWAPASRAECAQIMFNLLSKS